MANPAKIYLNRYHNLQTKCRSLEETIERLRERAESITMDLDPDKVQSSARIHDPIAEAAAAIADAEQLLREARRDAAESVNGILHTIDQMPDERLQSLLMLHYIDGMAWEDVAEFMSYSVRQIYNLHGIALQEINRIRKDCSELQS